MSKKLIINADDFGIAPETNKAVAELYAAGKITSTSLLVSAEGTAEAVELIKNCGIAFGVHLTLNSDFKEYPWKALCKCGSLIDDNGNLFADTKHIAKYAAGKDVTRECEAQIAAVRSWDVEPDHLDNHCGTMYGINLRAFFINAFKLSKKHNLPFRFPRRPAFLDGYFGGKSPAYIRAAQKVVVLCARAIGATIVDDIITNPFPIKDIPDYKTLEDYYLSAVSGIKDGITEMFLHPSYDAPKYSAITPEWKKREYELDFLFSSSLERRLKDEGIEIIGYDGR